MTGNRPPTMANLFQALVQREINDFTDTAGRPLGEQRSGLYAQTPTELRSCHHAGSRYQHANLMNISALKDILQVWEDILSLFSAVHQHYCRLHRKQVDTLADLFEISNTGILLADYLIYRAGTQLQTHEIPLLVSGFYKVCLGYRLVALPLLLEQLFAGNKTADVVPDNHGFYAYAEKNHIFIGATEVCSGSQQLIRQAYDAMTGRTIYPDRTEQITNLMINWPDFIRFAAHTSHLWLNLSLYMAK